MTSDNKESIALSTLQGFQSMLFSARVLCASDSDLDQMVELAEKILDYLKTVQSRRATNADKTSRQIFVETRRLARNDHSYQCEEILRTFRRVQRPLSATRLHWGYLKNLPVETLQERCNELATLGKLVKTVDKRSPDGRFMLSKS